MRQFIGSVRDHPPPDLASATRRPSGTCCCRAPPAVREAARALEQAELAMMERDDEPTQMALRPRARRLGRRRRLRRRGRSGTPAPSPRSASPTTGPSTASCARLSGGEQKRLALEALLRGPDEVLLLDEPDNYLDVPGKRWLEERLRETRKTVLFVCHDRELLARGRRPGRHRRGRGTAWVHGGGFATYHEARQARHDRLAELRRRWDEEHERLKELVRTCSSRPRSPGMASPLPGDADPAGEVRGGRPAAGAAARAEGHDAARRRAHRRAGGDLPSSWSSPG